MNFQWLLQNETQNETFVSSDAIKTRIGWRTIQNAILRAAVSRSWSEHFQENFCDEVLTRFQLADHCMKSVRIRSCFWSVFSYIRTEYRKIRTKNNSVFGHFSCSVLETYLKWQYATGTLLQILQNKIWNGCRDKSAEMDQTPQWSSRKKLFLEGVNGSNPFNIFAKTCEVCRSSGLFILWLQN